MFRSRKTGFIRSSPKIPISSFELIEEAARVEEGNGRLSGTSGRPVASSTSPVHGRAIVKCIGLGLRESWSDCSLLNHLVTARGGGGDRSLHWKSRSFPYANRIETCSSWKWRWPRITSSASTHTYADSPTRSICISQGTGTWPITEKRVHLDIYLRIEKSLARCHLGYEPPANFYVFEPVMHNPVMNNLWWQFHSCFWVLFVLNPYIFFFLALLLYSKEYGQYFCSRFRNDWINKFRPIFLCNFYLYLNKYIFNIYRRKK